ncbi:MAG: hypothetical protein AB7S38_25080 [Vulcanimicrobiota bacterium]
MNRRRFLSLVPVAALASLPALAHAPSGGLRGSLAGSEIAMTLSIDGGSVSGQYTYLKTGNTLTLSGTLLEQNCTLQEFYQGKHSGTFDGLLTTSGYEGIWSSPDGRSYRFQLG